MFLKAFVFQRNALDLGPSEAEVHQAGKRMEQMGSLAALTQAVETPISRIFLKGFMLFCPETRSCFVEKQFDW